MALGLAGIAYQTVEVSLRAKPPELLAISPKGTVPVMQLPDGTVLEQSLDIMRWALLQNDPDRWLTADTEVDINHWITLCDDTFKPLLDRYKYANRHPELTMEQHRERAMSAFILPLENALQAKRGMACKPSGVWPAGHRLPMLPYFRLCANLPPSIKLGLMLHLCQRLKLGLLLG